MEDDFDIEAFINDIKSNKCFLNYKMGSHCSPIFGKLNLFPTQTFTIHLLY